MFLEALVTILSFQNIFLIIIGVSSGIFIGALPGLSGSMAIALLISFTYKWELYPALIMMISVWVGAVYGGSKTSILINIPGTPAAVATSFDGFPLAKKGDAAYGIGLATLGSLIGGIIGALFLAILAPPIARFGLKFGSAEFFLLACWGLTAISSVSGNKLSKGILTAAMGLTLSTIGMDPMTGFGRFTFGKIQFMGGISFIPVLIGAFGLSEVFIQFEKILSKPTILELNKFSIRKYVKDIRRYISLITRCGIIGSVIGSIPGIGGEVASIVAYDHAKNSVKNPSTPFGEGAYEGIIAPETANNAALGGALIPLLTLGIPGDALTAVLLGAMHVHGLRPGPLVFNYDKTFFFVIVLAVFIAHLGMAFLGMVGNKTLAKIVTIPKSILLPIIVILSVVGSFAIQNRLFDVYIMVFFGFVGYGFKKFNYPIGPLVLGIILGNLADTSLRRTLMMFEGNILRAVYSNPISIILILLIFITVINQTQFFTVMKNKLFKCKTEGKR